MASAPRVLVIMDYQNIHLTAHGRWAPYGTPVHDSLIHPARFAQQLMRVRAERQRDSWQRTAELTRVAVFRGLPSNLHQPHMYAGDQAQKAEWERDPRVQVTYRPLRYPDGWPRVPAQEKGIDVLVPSLLYTRLNMQRMTLSSSPRTTRIKNPLWTWLRASER